MNNYDNPSQLPAAGMDALMRAEIDIQISTAHAYPRSLTRVARNVTDLVTMSEKAAKECIYSLPRSGTTIVGPSIRLAEILFSQWGNCTGGSRVVEVNRKEGYVEAEGVFHDLETNSKTVRRTRRNIKNKNGGLYNDDMITMTGNAAGSIAFRNAVLAGVPRSIWTEGYMKAEQVIRGDVKTLPERRKEAFKAMSAFGLSPDEVCKIVGVVGHKDVGLDELVIISGLHNSLIQEETTAEKLRASMADAIVRKKPDEKNSKKIAGDDADVVEQGKDKSADKDQDEPKPEKSADDPVDKEPTKDKDADETPAPAAKVAPEKHQRILDMLLADLADSPSVDSVVAFYEGDMKTQMEAMKAEAPEMYAQAQEAIKEARDREGQA